MRLKEWRLTHKMTMDACAKALGIDHARSYQRYESGAHNADAAVIEKIRRMTDGAVGPDDMHAQRFAWLAENKPAAVEGVEAIQPVCEAAQ